jgi:hypothetical protein
MGNKLNIAVLLIRPHAQSRSAVMTWFEGLKDNLDANVYLITAEPDQYSGKINYDNLLEYNFEKGLNYQPYYPDICLCTCAEAVIAAKRFCNNVVYYTHDWFLVYPVAYLDDFSSEYIGISRDLLADPEIIVGASTDFIKESIERSGCQSKNIRVLPLLFPKTDIKDIPCIRGVGMLWYGYITKEDVKGYQRFLEEAKKAGYVKVLTIDRDVERIKKDLDNLGIRCSVKANLHGDEKIRFISEASWCLLTSKHETFSLFAAEAASRKPTYYAEFRPWMKFHIDNFNVQNISRRGAKSYQKRKKSLAEYNECAIIQWNEFLHTYENLKETK